MATSRCQTCGRRTAGPHPTCPPRAPAPQLTNQLALPPGYAGHSLLGEGGYGVVWRATREATGAACAVKLAPPGIPAARLEQEASALQALPEGLAPAYLAHGPLEAGGAFLAMEALVGSPLSDRLEAVEAGLPSDELRALVPALLDAVERLHAAGWLHLDLKPDNCFFHAGQLRLLDFGTALRAGAATQGAGTAEYVSPEQLDGAPLTWASDLYAVGVMLFELATGRTPFFGSPAEISNGHRSLRPPRLGELAPDARWLEPFVEAALHKRPEDRPASWAAARALLSAPERAAAAPPSAPRPAASTDERRSVGLLFFETTLAPGDVQQLAAELRAQIAAASGDRFAFAFEAADTDNLAVRALTAARVLVSRGVTARARVDVQTLTVQRRPDGGRRYVGAALMKKGAWPTADAAPVTSSEVAERLAREAEWLTPTLLSAQGGPRKEEGPLFGRDAVLAELDAAAATARSGKGVVVRVVGEAGLGRSRLARSLQGRLTAAGFTCVGLKAREAVPGQPSALAVELARAATDGAAEPRVLHERLIARLGPGPAEPAWRALQLVMGWLEPEAADALVSTVPPAALRSSTAQALGELVRARATGGRVAITLDDAHLADDRVLDALEYATLAGCEVALLVVALGRPALINARPALGQRADARVALELQPLPEADAAALCRHLLQPAQNVADVVVHRITERAGRNPQLLAELVHGLLEQGLLVKRPTGDGYVVVSEVIEQVPNLPLVEWTARRELQNLSAELRAHARLAAVVGGATLAQHLGAANALEALGQRDLAPLDARFALGRLLERQVLQLGRDGVLRFRMPLVRDLLLTEGPPAGLTVLHDAALRFFEADPATSGLARFARIARHAEGSADTTRAATAWLQAGLEAARRHALVDADQSLTRALGLLPADDARRLQALRTRGITRTRLSRYADAKLDLEGAHAETQRLGDATAEMDVLLWWATALDWMSDFAGARTRVEAARRLYDTAPAPALEATLLFNEGRDAARFENLTAAAVTLRRALRLLENTPGRDEETRTEAQVLLLYLLPLEGRLDEASALLAELRARCGAVGDRIHEGAALLNTRSLWLARGEVERGLLAMQEAARIGRELGEQFLEYGACCNTAELLLLSGQADRAVVAARAAIAVEARSSEVVSGPFAHLIAARAYLAAGQRPQAADEVHLISGLLDADAGALLPNELLLLELVRAALADADSEVFLALAQRASSGGLADELTEVATVWARAHPAERADIETRFGPTWVARVAQQRDN